MISKCTRGSRSVLVVIVLLLAGTRSDAEIYALTDLGTLGGTMASCNGHLPSGPPGNLSQGFGINTAGQVTGSSLTAFGDQHAFLYTPGANGAAGAISDIGTPQGTCSGGVGINDVGKITGWWIENGSQVAFLYSPLTGALSPLPSPGLTGRSINAGGGDRRV